MVAPHNQKKIDIVIDLRGSGMSYAEIGRVLGVSRQAIRQMVLRAVARNPKGDKDVELDPKPAGEDDEY